MKHAYPTQEQLVQMQMQALLLRHVAQAQGQAQAQQQQQQQPQQRALPSLPQQQQQQQQRAPPSQAQQAQVQAQQLQVLRAPPQTSVVDVILRFRVVPAVANSVAEMKRFRALPLLQVMAWAASDALVVHGENCVLHMLCAWASGPQGKHCGVEALRRLGQHVRARHLGPAFSTFVLKKLPSFGIQRGAADAAPARSLMPAQASCELRLSAGTLRTLLEQGRVDPRPHGILYLNGFFLTIALEVLFHDAVVVMVRVLKRAMAAHDVPWTSESTVRVALVTVGALKKTPASQVHLQGFEPAVGGIPLTSASVLRKALDGMKHGDALTLKVHVEGLDAQVQTSAPANASGQDDEAAKYYRDTFDMYMGALRAYAAYGHRGRS